MKEYEKKKKKGWKLIENRDWRERKKEKERKKERKKEQFEEIDK